jgi:hypothetical protein
MFWLVNGSWTLRSVTASEGARVRIPAKQPATAMFRRFIVQSASVARTLSK